MALVTTIKGPDGSLYMRRFSLWRLRLHIFYLGDMDENPHDHPWDFWTFPLTPYVEEVLDMKDGKPYRLRANVVRAFKLHFRPAEYAHRVLGRFEGWMNWDHVSMKNSALVPIHSFHDKIYTLVWVSKKRRKWGYWDIKRFFGTQWKEENDETTDL